MANVTFGLKEPKSKNDTLIFLYFSYGNKRPFKYSTKDKINPADWSTDKQRIRVKRSVSNADERNAYLSLIESSIKSVYQMLLLEGKDINDGIIRERLDVELNRKQKQVNNDLMSYLDYIVKLKKEIKSTDRYIVKMASDNLKEFSIKKGRYLNFENMNLSFRDEFVSFLEDQQYQQNSICTCFAALSIILNQAQQDGLNPFNYFRDKRFSAKKERVKKFAFTEEELLTILRVDLSNEPPIWDDVRDNFLIGAFTAMRVSDYSKLSDESIQGNMIYRKTQKTGASVVIPVHWAISEIIAKRGGTLPPTRSKTSISIFIKLIAKKCNFNQPVLRSYTKGGKRIDEIKERWETVNTHDARRSGIRNMLKAGIERSRVMKFSGHTSESSFNVYADLDEEQNAIELADHSFFKQSSKAPE